jgi:acyl-CoA reductase-like NAD-dependent aldehyde dehydrogenase
MRANMGKTLNFIDGEYCASSSGKWFDNRSPVDGHIVSIVEEASAADVDRAV